jgi:hypothetical protein
MQITFIACLVATIYALIGAAVATPLSSTDIENRMLANATFIGVVEGHPFELQGHASVCFLSIYL